MTETFLHFNRWSVEAVLSGSGRYKFLPTNNYVQVLYLISFHGTVTHSYTVMRCITFWSTADCMYDGGPIRLVPYSLGV